jgi:hypothetical protein
MYAAAGDRCIVELTARLGPLVTLRRRLTADEASLTVAHSAADCVLSLKLTGAALGGDELSFVSTEMEPEPAPEPAPASGPKSGESWLHLTGELATGDPTVPSVPAILSLRVVERAENLLLVLGTLQVPYRHLRRTTGFVLSRIRPADRLRLLVAAEFTCPA